MSGWPTIREAAFHGPAGEFVLRTEPHTEADPVALLAQFLVCFGVAAGRRVSYTVEATAHHLNEFAVLVGPTGKGRKAPPGITCTRCSSTPISGSSPAACHQGCHRARG